MKQKFAMALAVLLVPVGTVTLVGVGGASAATRAVKGTVACQSLSATVAFKPALTPTGISKEKSTIKPIALGGCTSNGSPVSPTSVLATIKTNTTNSCANFASAVSSDSITLIVKLPGASLTKVSFKPGSLAVNSTDTGFVASGGKATGSFATTSAGFSANISSASASALTKCIGGTGGVSSLQISSGAATL